MTDISGQFHQVMIASSFESLTAYEEAQKTMSETPEEKKVMDNFSNMNEMYFSGSREILIVW